MGYQSKFTGEQIDEGLLKIQDLWTNEEIEAKIKLYLYSIDFNKDFNNDFTI